MSTQVLERPTREPATEHDLAAAVLAVLQDSGEPIPPSKIKSGLPSSLKRVTSAEDIAEVLRRQVGAHVLWEYPKYRGPQERYWDRPMQVHVSSLIRAALQDQPLAWPELRRKLPIYTQSQAEEVLQDLVKRGQVHRLPRPGRGGERYWIWPPNPKDYLHEELEAVFARLQTLGFTRDQLRGGALEMLHEEEWAARNPAQS